MPVMLKICSPDIEMPVVNSVFEFHRLLTQPDGSKKFFHQSKPVFSKPARVPVQK